MIGHLFIDVKVGRRRRIETGQQLVHDNQQPHPTRLLDKALFDRFLKLLHPLASLILALAEKVRQHLAIDMVFRQLFGQPSTGRLSFDVTGIRLIAGDDGTLVSKSCLTEQLIAFASLIDTGAHQHGIATAIRQALFTVKIEQDIGHDLLES